MSFQYTARLPSGASATATVQLTAASLPPPRLALLFSMPTGFSSASITADRDPSTPGVDCTSSTQVGGGVTPSQPGSGVCSGSISAGAFTLSAPAVPGLVSSWSCSLESAHPTPTPLALTGGGNLVTLAAGQAVTCVAEYSNDPVSAVADAYSYTHGPAACASGGGFVCQPVPLTVPAASGLLNNDAGTGIFVHSVTQPASGSVSFIADGSFTFTPAAGQTGARMQHLRLAELPCAVRLPQ